MGRVWRPPARLDQHDPRRPRAGAAARARLHAADRRARPGARRAAPPDRADLRGAGRRGRRRPRARRRARARADAPHRAGAGAQLRRVSFQAPLLLALLGLVPLAAVAYVLAQRRRRRFAVRYTNVDVLALVSAGRSWGRHLPALFGLLALAALLVALARPQHTVAAVRHEATVMLLTDTSGSMTANDAKPTRLAAAKAAARTFAGRVPADFRLGLITFGTSAQQLAEPTTDHARVLAAIDSMRVHGGTAMGDGIRLAVDSARAPVPDGLGGSRRLPGGGVVLSPGAAAPGGPPLRGLPPGQKKKNPGFSVGPRAAR